MKLMIIARFVMRSCASDCYIANTDDREGKVAGREHSMVKHLVADVDS